MTVEFAGWDGQAKDQASQAVQDFKAYLEAHKDEITALQIFYNQPHRRKDLTYAMIRELLERLKLDKPTLAPLRIWKAYERLDKVSGGNPVNELVALVSLLRRITGIDATLTPYDKTVDKNFQAWVFQKQAGHAQIHGGTDGVAPDDEGAYRRLHPYRKGRPGLCAL